MISKGEPLLYVQIQKALYGLLRIALLLYRKLVKYLEACGLQTNSYNPFLANKMINDKHIMLVCCLDDLKLSHVNKF